MKQDIVWLISRLNRQRLRLLRAALTPMGYVGTMHLILLYLNRHPGASQEEIAVFGAIDKGSLARDAGRLEQLGHIRREVDPQNRRKNLLYLTPEGKTALKTVLEIYSSYNEGITQGLSEEEIETLSRLLTRMDDNCKAMQEPFLK